MNQNKRVRKEHSVLSEWFLSKLLDYLNIQEIRSLDSAICNKSDREVWLECIARNYGSLSTKVEPYVFIRGDRAIKWCATRNVRFEKLDLFFGFSKHLSVTGTKLLAKLCTNLVDLRINASSPTKKGKQIIQSLLRNLGKQCSMLKRIDINFTSITDSDIIPLFESNHNVEALRLLPGDLLTDATAIAITNHCPLLHKVFLPCRRSFSAQAMAPLSELIYINKLKQH